MELWESPDWILQIRRMLNSYARFTERELIERSGDDLEDARHAFLAPFVIVAHGTESDPLLNYGNAAALELWEAEPHDLIGMPSRKTAEPQHRDERARLLEETTRRGFFEDYRGIRISLSGRRFEIHSALVWNIVDENGHAAGQAATFSDWTFLDEMPEK